MLRLSLYLLGSLTLVVWMQAVVLARPDGIVLEAQPEVRTQPIAQSLESPELDESLSDLKASFSRIKTIGIPDFALGSPGYTLAIPSGYGVDWGSVYFAAGGVATQRFEDEAQGGVAVGLGLGTATRLLGLEVNYAIPSLEEGSSRLSLKLHRNLLAQDRVNAALAIGWEDMVTTGDTVSDSTVYGVATTIIKLKPDINNTFSRLALTVGLGGGRFRRQQEIFNGEDTVGIFGGASIRIRSSVSGVAEWTGQDLSVGFSWAPIRDQQFYITPSLRDLAGDGDQVRFSLTAGWSLEL